MKKLISLMVTALMVLSMTGAVYANTVDDLAAAIEAKYPDKTINCKNLANTIKVGTSEASLTDSDISVVKGTAVAFSSTLNMADVRKLFSNATDSVPDSNIYETYKTTVQNADMTGSFTIEVEYDSNFTFGEITATAVKNSFSGLSEDIYDLDDIAVTKDTNKYTITVKTESGIKAGAVNNDKLQDITYKISNVATPNTDGTYSVKVKMSGSLEFSGTGDSDTVTLGTIKFASPEATRSVTTYTRSSGGGSSRPTTTTQTTKNEDGSTTTTVTNNKTGTVTETTENTDGSTTTVETKKDGTVTTTEKDADGNKTTTVENADGSTKTEEKLKDGTTITTETTKDGETTITVDTKKETEVEIPVEDSENVSGIVITDKNGNQTTITDFEVTDGGVKFTVSGKYTVEVEKTQKEPVKEFDDVQGVSHWAKDAVEYVVSKGLMNGISENEFAPDMSLTRAMLVTVLYRLTNEPETNADVAFGDVVDGSYYEKAVKWAQENGIVNGITENEFAPDVNITREQITTILYRYAKYMGYDVTQGGMQIREFADYEEISDYALEAMTWAVNVGLVKGRGNNNVAPKDFATRAEIATILQRFIELNK